MNSNTRTATAIVVGMILLLAASANVTAQGNSEQSRPRTIEVSGYGAAHGSPDVAVVRLGVESRSPEVKRALSTVSAAMNAVLAAARTAGVADSDIATVAYDVSFVPDNGRGGAAAEGSPSGSYRVTDVAAITVRNLDSLAAVLDGTLAAGANEVQGISFQLSDPTALQREARTSAMADAHERAAQLAALASVRLGPVISVSESGGGPPPGGAPLHAAAFAAAPPVSPGQLSVDVSVRVTYAIQ
ncbi:SIMPL domain-containing protein [Salinispira pacifica]